MTETTMTQRCTGRLEARIAENPRIRVTVGAAGRANPANSTELDCRRPTVSRTPRATGGPVGLDGVPHWLPHLPWFDHNTRSWVLDYNGDDRQLLFDAENWTLNRADDIAAAQAWAGEVCRGPAAPDGDRLLPVAAGHHVTVSGRTGWVPLFDPDHMRKAVVRDHHEPSGDITGCCAWPPAATTEATA